MDPAACRHGQPPRAGRPARQTVCRIAPACLGWIRGQDSASCYPQGDQAWGGVDPEGRGLGSSVIRYPPSGMERGPDAPWTAIHTVAGGHDPRVCIIGGRVRWSRNQCGIHP